jgi:hypothetical protein
MYHRLSQLDAAVMAGIADRNFKVRLLTPFEDNGIYAIRKSTTASSLWRFESHPTAMIKEGG